MSLRLRGAGRYATMLPVCGSPPKKRHARRPIHACAALFVFHFGTPSPADDEDDDEDDEEEDDAT